MNDSSPSVAPLASAAPRSGERRELAARATHFRPAGALGIDPLLRVVNKAARVIGPDLTTPNIKAWAAATYGIQWREDMAARIAMAMLHAMSQWRRVGPPVSYYEYLCHRVHAVEGCQVIDPEAHDALRILVPRPDKLRLFGLTTRWDHPWSEACRS